MTAVLHIEGVSFYWERKVLEEKLETIRQHCQDTLENSVVMIEVLHEIAQEIRPLDRTPKTDY